MSFGSGALAWWALGVALIALEMLLPGVFLVWFGVAALGVGLLVWLVPDLHLLAQVLSFAALAFATIHVYRTYFARRERASEQPLLNRRGEQLIGRIYPLEQPIVDGYGRIRVGDTLWAVRGPDLPAGARVRVLAVSGMDLEVARVDD